MNLSFQNPWSMVDRLQNELDRMLPARHARLIDGDRQAPGAAPYAPPVDIREEEDRYVILADIPGVAPSDIEITAERGVLTLKGERRDEGQAAETVMRRVERATGNFVRRFALPEDIDVEQIAARGEHGVLVIVLPKGAQTRQRRITVQ